MTAQLVESSTLEAGVVAVTLNRPEKRNALCVPLLEQLCIQVKAADDEPTTRVIVLRANGPVFCAGLDLDEAADAARAERSAHLIADALQIISSCRAVTIAAVHGSAIAGGAGIMSACDFVIVGETAKFGYPEVHRGLVPGLVLTFLRRQLRERDIRELVLLGELFDAAKAMEIGLVNRVVQSDQVPQAVAELAGKLKRGGPQAIAATKRLLDALWHRGIPADLQAAHEHHIQARNSDEAREGMAAFREKREAKW